MAGVVFFDGGLISMASYLNFTTGGGFKTLILILEDADEEALAPSADDAAAAAYAPLFDAYSIDSAAAATSA